MKINKTSFIATALCLMSFNAPSFAQSGSTASDPSMNTNTGAMTTDSGAMRSSDTAGSAGTTSGSMSGSANNTAAGTTTDTSAARSGDVNTAATTDSARESTYVQNEEGSGRSPFFYILLALIAFALISYAVKASKRNNPHHGNRNL